MKKEEINIYLIDNASWNTSPKDDEIDYRGRRYKFKPNIVNEQGKLELLRNCSFGFVNKTRQEFIYGGTTNGDVFLPTDWVTKTSNELKNNKSINLNGNYSKKELEKILKEM